MITNEGLTDAATKSILIGGASTGLDLGIAGEYASRGWRMIGTVRASNPPTGILAFGSATK
jgi:NAD(P)-dependent dehydrogenase (short-subunit alcohol dehydrogenase family)